MHKLKRAGEIALWCIIVLATAVVLLIIAYHSTVHAADLPCPPRFYTCLMVRNAVAQYGQDAVEVHARACGWTESQIKAAKRCLK